MIHIDTTVGGERGGYVNSKDLSNILDRLPLWLCDTLGANKRSLESEVPEVAVPCSFFPF